MKSIVRIIAIIYSLVYAVVVLMLLIDLKTVAEEIGWTVLSVVIITGAVNVILLWAVSGLMDRVNRLEGRFRKADEEAENEWFKHFHEQD